MKSVFQTKSSKETKNLAKKVAKALRPGDVVALNGDLGGGKTTFTKGLAEACGVAEPITSPTFMLSRVFKLTSGINSGSPAASHFYHFDVYRLESSQELIDIGFVDIVDDKNSIVVVEWADKVENLIPEDAIKIKFSFVDDKTREITVWHPRQKI